MTWPAKLIPVEGAISDVEIGRFEDLSPLIGGGHVEVVRIQGGRLIVDEEGLLKGLARNVRASVLYAGGHIVGDVLLFTEQAFQAFDQSLAR